MREHFYGKTHVIILYKHFYPFTEVPGNSLLVIVGGSVAGVAAAAVAALLVVIVFRRKHRLGKGMND